MPSPIKDYPCRPSRGSPGPDEKGLIIIQTPGGPQTESPTSRTRSCNQDACKLQVITSLGRPIRALIKACGDEQEFPNLWGRPIAPRPSEVSSGLARKVFVNIDKDLSPPPRNAHHFTLQALTRTCHEPYAGPYDSRPSEVSSGLARKVFINIDKHLSPPPRNAHHFTIQALIGACHEPYAGPYDSRPSVFFRKVWSEIGPDLPGSG